MSVELVLALQVLVEIVLWVWITIRFRKDLGGKRPTRASLVILLLWATIGAQVVRSLADYGIVSRDWMNIAAAASRGLFVLVGLVFVLAGPAEDDGE